MQRTCNFIYSNYTYTVFVSVLLYELEKFHYCIMCKKYIIAISFKRLKMVLTISKLFVQFFLFFKNYLKILKYLGSVLRLATNFHLFNTYRVINF
jgi:hypothetical protein